MKILICGGYGFVGTNIFNFLKKNKTHKIYRFKSSEYNLKILNNSKKVIKKYNPDLIINCAGRVGGILVNQNKNLEFLNDNFLINYNLINTAKELKVPIFINLSSSCIYPYKKDKIKESDFLSGAFEKTNEGYAFSKAFAQKLTEYHDDPKNNFFYKTLIPCNLFGEFDDFDLESSHLVPAIIKKISMAKNNLSNEIKIFGDGTPKREFMYIGNLVEIISKLISKKLYKILPPCINIGTGIDFSVYNYHVKIAKLMNFNPKFVFDLKKPNGIKRKLLNTSLMQKYNLFPIYSLEDGLKKTIKFYEENYE